MNNKEIETIIGGIIKVIPDSLNGCAVADLYVYLGAKLGMEHLLMPDARPNSAEHQHLPIEAPELYQQRADRRELPHEFIERGYGSWMGKGLARHHILQLDKPLYMALANWLKKNNLPEGFNLPTKKELNDRELERIGLREGETLPYPSYYNGLKQKLRLYNAARNRRQ